VEEQQEEEEEEEEQEEEEQQEEEEGCVSTSASVRMEGVECLRMCGVRYVTGPCCWQCEVCGM
jgi:hypothetical protein